LVEVELPTVCAEVVVGVTLFPGKNVANLLRINFDVGGMLTAPSSLFQEVSSNNKKARIIAVPTRPAVHLYV